jgi:hypothetical protein
MQRSEIREIRLGAVHDMVIAPVMVVHPRIPLRYIRAT